MRRLLAACCAALFLSIQPAQAQTLSPAPDEIAASQRPSLGVFTTLPLAWGEADDLFAVIRGESEPHWLRGALDANFSYRPIDAIDAETIAPLDVMLFAQPRALSPSENVALDDWVRAGGRLLIFADPMMTEHSHFPIGDRRRPHDTALLSPILARWGLTMTMQDDQPGAARLTMGDTAIPVALHGTFVAREPAGGAQSDCTLYAEALIARCAIGAGRAVVMADAAMLDAELGDFAVIRTALSHLLNLAFLADS